MITEQPFTMSQLVHLCSTRHLFSVFTFFFGNNLHINTRHSTEAAPVPPKCITTCSIICSNVCTISCPDSIHVQLTPLWFASCQHSTWVLNVASMSCACTCMCSVRIVAHQKKIQRCPLTFLDIWIWKGSHRNP